jgi:hypothetical protein
MTKWVGLTPPVTLTWLLESTATCVLTATFWLVPAQLTLLVAGAEMAAL